MRILPTPPDSFLGREEELDRLRRFFSRRHLLLIEGIAGLGKTALALRFLAELKGAGQSRCILYVACLPGWGLEELIEEVSAWLPASAEAPPPEGADPREKLVALIGALNRREAVLCLDDVHLLPPEQLATLLRLFQTYLTARALLISREEPPLDPMERVELYEERLQELSPQASVQLLQSLLELHGRPAEPAAAEELAAAAGGHPFLIKLVASLLLTRPGAAEVLAAGRRDYLVSQVLGRVTPAEQAVLEVLSLARDALDEEAVARLCGHPEAACAVSSLERRFLLERDPAGGLLVHRLLGDQVEGALEPERKAGLHRRLSRHFEGAGNLQEAFRHALEGGEPERAAQLLQQGAGGMCSRGHYRALLEGIEGLEKSLPELDGRLRLAQANTLSILGRWQESLTILEPLTRRPEVAVDAEIAMASVYLNRGDWLAALRGYEAALRRLPQGSDSVSALKCLNYLAVIRGFRGELRQALELLQRSLGAARRLGDPASLAHALRVEATVRCFQGSFEEAARAARESLEMARRAGAARLGCWARYALALALHGLGDSAGARAELEENLRLGKGLGDPHVLGFSFQALGEVARDQGQLAQAEEAFEASARAFRAASNRLEEWVSRGRQAMLWNDPEARPATLETLQSARAVARELGNPWFEAEALLAMAEIALDAGCPQEASGHCEEALSLLATLDLPGLLAQALVLRWEAGLARGEQAAVSLPGDLEKYPPATAFRAWTLLSRLPGQDEAVRRHHAERAADARARLTGWWRRQAERFLARLDQGRAGPVLAPVPTPGPADRLEVQCLGRFRLRLGGKVVEEGDWPSRKAMKLFALLALRRGAAQPDEVLADLFWPDLDGQRARAALRNALYQVRGLLKELLGPPGAAAVVRSRKAGTVALELDFILDTEAFEADYAEAAGALTEGQAERARRLLERALARCRGELLEGFEEAWTEGPRAHYHELVLRARHLLAQCCLRLGDPAAAEDAARAGLAQDDLREELHVDLMEAMVARHRKAEAMRHYREAAAHFEREVGLVPPAFEAVYRTLVV
jgi:ATP/maltotriose-dependent transcriptional regulator MalT